VTWQSIGCEGIGLADRGRRPRRSTSNDVAQRRAVADRGHPRCSTLGDVANGKADGARALADQGRDPRRSTSSDVAERGV
jgi:hypothetical protein